MGCSVSIPQPPADVAGNYPSSSQAAMKERARKSNGTSSAASGSLNEHAAATTAAVPKVAPPPKPNEGGKPRQRRNVGQNNPLATHDSAPKGAQRLPGIKKYIIEYGSVVMNDTKRDGQLGGVLLLFCDPGTDNVVVSYRDLQLGQIFVKELSTQDIIHEKEAAGIQLPWGPFFKSITSDILKTKATVVGTATKKKEVRLAIVSNKEPGVSYPFTFTLDLASVGEAGSDRALLMKYVLMPMTRRIQKNRHTPTNAKREQTIAQLHSERALRRAGLVRAKDTTQRLLQYVKPLREESVTVIQQSMNLVREVSHVERRIRQMREGSQNKSPLDRMYDEGGAQYFKHLDGAEDHFPQEVDPDSSLSTCVRAAFPLEDMALDTVPRVLLRPELQQMLRDAPRQMIHEVFQAFRLLDNWDFDAIQLDTITNGNALFYTTYAILYKLDLVRQFRLDDVTLRNFLTAVQAGYHPNPYHNSLHASDVTQINYYIICKGGLAEKVKISPEVLLGCVLAGAIHDYDHPGFNNNFHTRTNAYLATLYNDRSILENHHCACVFEILRKPKYDIFAVLSDDQRQVVRETMLEMVLSTDMGNHGKILKNFQSRLSDGIDWSARKEDQRLALSMSIKMADISNCARPLKIYEEWARRISQEFYNQGDWEAKLKIPISPFMDRARDATDFTTGQISFMTYVVQPTLESLATLLPQLSFAVQHCSDNREHWKRVESNSAK